MKLIVRANTTDDRPVAADGVQVTCLGHPVHSTRDVQLPHASHPAALPCTTAVSPAQSGRCTSDQPDAAASLVCFNTII